MSATAVAVNDRPAEDAAAERQPAPAALATAAGLPVDPAGRAIALRRSSRSAVRTAAAQRRRPLPLGRLSFVLVVVLPAVVAAVYFLFVAADQYVAEFRFGLRFAEPAQSQPGAVFQPSVAPARIGLDSYVIVQYIASRAIVDDLGKSLDLQRMFSSSKADWLTRLRLPVPVEELVNYWNGQVDAFFDATNGTIVVRVRAFTPQDAAALARGILASSERLVNDMSARARRDALRSSEQEVHRAEQRLTAALAQLREFRDREGLIDPHKAADSTEALDSRVRDELLRDDTDLSTLKQYLRGDAAPLKILEARIQSLKDQRRSVESGVTNTAKPGSPALSRVMGGYEQLESERSFAENAYRHALAALDQARMNADRQQVYLADFVQPSLPEEALYPRRLHSVAVVLLIAFAVWAIGSLTVRSVRDHL